MFKILWTLMIISLTSITSLNQLKINNYHKTEEVDTTILKEQSLPLAFETGNFYQWNENDESNMIAGIFTNSQT